MTRRLLVVFLLIGSCGISSGRVVTPNPRVLAQVSLTSQSDPIPATTILTFPANGLYRITGYAELTATGTCSQDWLFTFQWVDDTGLQQDQELTGFVCSAIASAGKTIIVRGLKGAPLTYTVSGTPGSGSEFDLFFTVERLM